MFDVEKQTAVPVLQLYLTPDEAMRFRDELNKLLDDPEAKEQAHIDGGDARGDLSFSIITPKKLANMEAYSALEQRLLKGK
jgi:hypothetical protein